MSDYRKIFFPRCPYCNTEVKASVFNSDYGRLVSMCNGHGTDNVIIQCRHCNKKYRVTCTIKFNVRKEGEQNE